MSEDTVIEGEAAEIPGEETSREEKAAESKATAAALRDALERVESLGKTLTSALQDRANVVMVRVNDDALKHLDMLIEADITKSRSESAAFLITEGIKANRSLFDKIGSITEQIVTLRTQLRESVKIDPVE
jgi:exosome complex RNA-binding protein Csl4